MQETEKVLMHIAVFVTGIVSADVKDTDNIKVELRFVKDDGSSYSDSIHALPENVYRIIQQTGAQVMLDALQAKLRDSLRELSEDVTLNHTAKGGDA
jgi:glucan phosphoethanolaminetransferase (alkaline phosphatase superfamily)